MTCYSCEEMFEDIGHQFWDGEQCVSCFSENADTPVWDSGSKRCISCPDDKPNWSAETGECR